MKKKTLDKAYDRIISLGVPRYNLDLYISVYQAIKEIHGKHHKRFPAAIEKFHSAVDWLVNNDWISVYNANKINKDIYRLLNPDKFQSALVDIVKTAAEDTGELVVNNNDVIINGVNYKGMTYRKYGGRGRKPKDPALEFIVYVLYHDLNKYTKRPRYGLISDFLQEQFNVDRSYDRLPIMLKRINKGAIGDRLLGYQSVSTDIFTVPVLLHFKEIFPDMNLPNRALGLPTCNWTD